MYSILLIFGYVFSSSANIYVWGDYRSLFDGHFWWMKRLIDVCHWSERSNIQECYVIMPIKRILYGVFRMR